MKPTKDDVLKAIAKDSCGCSLCREHRNTIAATIFALFNPPTLMQVTEADVGKICRFPTTLRAEDDVAVFSHKEGDYFVSDANGEYASAKPWYGFQFIPHEDRECPVPEDWLIRYNWRNTTEDNEYIDTGQNLAKHIIWSQIVDYLPIDESSRPHEERIRKIVEGEL